MSLVIEDRTCFSGFCPCLYYNAVLRHVKQDWLCQPCLACILLITFPIFLRMLCFCSGKSCSLINIINLKRGVLNKYTLCDYGTIDWCCDTFGYWCYEWIIWNNRETTERKATENYQCSESIGGINTWIRRWKGLLLFFFIWFNVKIWYSSSKDLYIILRNLIKWRKKI